MRHLDFGADARKKAFEGVVKLNKAVACTMGPKGRNVIIQKENGLPVVTKDGVTVAKEVHSPDPVEEMAIQVVRQAAIQTNESAGDGTTTATVLAHAMIEEGMKHLGKGANPISIKRGMDKAVKSVTDYLSTIKKDVSKTEEYAAVATISAQDSEIGQIVADTFTKVGSKGLITVESSPNPGLAMEHADGMQIDAGLASFRFITNQKLEAVHEKIAVLVTDKRISSFQDLLPVLQLLKSDKRLVIFADAVDGDAIQNAVMNHMEGNFTFLIVKAPAAAERRKAILKDIAIVTGANLITDETGLKLQDATLEDLGTARRISSTKDRTLIVGSGKKADIENRVKEIDQLILSATGFDKEQLIQRKAKLTGGVAVIKVGAATEVEMIERQHRVEDAISATRAAAEEGILPGGGTAYMRAYSVLKDITGSKDELVGVAIVGHALLAPARTILLNAGFSVDVLEQIALSPQGHGFNSNTGEMQNLVENMVIDPKKVSRCALENAASVAAMFLTLETSISIIPDVPTNHLPAA
jgi:chaperonin GroEL